MDEIDFSIGMIASTFDVAQVECCVARRARCNGCPRWTHQGENGDAEPVREPARRLSAGSDGFWSAGAVAGDGFAAGRGIAGAWRAVIQRAVGDGFRDNRFLGQDDTSSATRRRRGSSSGSHPRKAGVRISR